MHAHFADGPNCGNCCASLLYKYFFLMLASIFPCFHSDVSKVPQNAACFTWEVQGRYEMLSSFTPSSCRCHAPDVSTQKVPVSAFAFKTDLDLIVGEVVQSPHPKAC